jgi:hypothetical protein
MAAGVATEDRSFTQVSKKISTNDGAIVGSRRKLHKETDHKMSGLLSKWE